MQKKLLIILSFFVINIFYGQNFNKGETVQLRSQGKLKETEKSTANTIILIPKDDYVKIIKKLSNGVYKVNYKNYEGYINEIYFSENIINNSKPQFSPSYNTKSDGFYITKVNAHLLKNKHKSSEILLTVPKGEKIQIIGEFNNLLSKVRYKGKTGYMSGQDINKIVIRIKNSHFTVNDNQSKLPPILIISEITFSENVLNAEQIAQLTLSIKNLGPGDAKNVYASLSGSKIGLEYPIKSYFPVIKANGGKEEITINIKGNLDLPTAEAIINIEVIEPNFKVNIQGKQLKFSTREFQKPKLILAQHILTENQSANPNKQIDINEMVDLKFAIQNIGQGNADNVNIDVKNNQKGVLLLGIVNGNELNRNNPIISEIQPGEYETVTYRYFVNSEFTESKLQFNIESEERTGKYGFSITKSFPINKQIKETGYIRTLAQTTSSTAKEVVIKDIPNFIVDVDSDIPITKTKQTDTYALIIGNEDYKSKQRGLTIEQNVDFAINDAEVFKLYCEKTLGIPNEQIFLLKNATSAEISRELNKLSILSKLDKGKAKLIFYYSGHGLPHEQTKESYLIPVDVTGENLDYAIKLSDVYNKLTEYPAEQITVFLDACFSGGARNQGLLAMKGIKVKPKKDIISGNMVVFTSSSGRESSAVYREKQHGYFTYYLLKKLKETEGEIDYFNLGEFIINSVSKKTTLNGTLQTPQVNVSLKVENEWKLWKLK